jgi:hypothetical protein
MPAVPSSWGVFLMPPNQFVFIERPHAQLQCIGEPSNKESRQSDPQGEEGGGGWDWKNPAKHMMSWGNQNEVHPTFKWDMSISGLVVEYIVAIDVTRVRFPADALFQCPICLSETLQEDTLFPMNTSMCKMKGCEVGGK